MAEFPTIEEMALEIKDKAIKMIEQETGVSFERLMELAAADKEGRCVVFEIGYPVVKTYDAPHDENGLYTMEVCGVISEDKYKAMLKEKGINDETKI